MSTVDRGKSTLAVAEADMDIETAVKPEMSTLARIANSLPVPGSFFGGY